MKTLKDIRALTEGAPEEKIVKKQQSINNILAAFRTGKLDKATANQKLRQKGHQGVNEAKVEPKKGKSLKTFRGARTATGQEPNPIDLDPKLTLNRTVQAMSHKGY